MNTKTVLRIWDDENYNYADAMAADAVTEINVPDNLTARESSLFMQGIELALRASGKRLANYEQKLQYKDVRLTPYLVTQDLLEINTYTATVYAENVKALQGIMEKHTLVEFDGMSIETWGASTNHEQHREWSHEIQR